ncbi:MAG: hypothetical protein F4W91_07615 [Gemmatimonadetes bacterium]|nr:hypothetical protein [Gemmatimonadota bacterium]
MGRIRHVCYVLAILVNCFGCQEVPLSSDLVSSPPESIIGYTLILRVTHNDGNPSNLSVGRAYAFSFAGQREVIIHDNMDKKHFINLYVGHTQQKVTGQQLLLMMFLFPTPMS